MRFINQLITGGHHPVTIWYHYDITMFEHGDVTPHWGNCSKGKRMFVSVEAISQQTHMCHGARLSPYNWVFISWVITHLPISSTNSLAHLSMIPSKNGKQQRKRTIHFLHMLFCSFTLKRQQLRVVSWIMFPCDKKCVCLFFLLFVIHSNHNHPCWNR